METLSYNSYMKTIYTNSLTYMVGRNIIYLTNYLPIKKMYKTLDVLFIFQAETQTIHC
jgi:hypothetical protein